MAAPSSEENLLPSRENCIYTSCYCEENIWLLCDHIRKTHPEELCNCYAVFISNTEKQIPIWRQQACLEPENPIVWDYHVIFVRCCDCGSDLYDLDTQLPFPCELNKYVEEALCYDDKLEAKYRRSFRVIPASLYLEKFASDRSHMLDDDGIFRTAPPTYPCITTPEIQNNLEDFINMDPAVGYGEIMTLRKFVSKFNSTKTKNR